MSNLEKLIEGVLDIALAHDDFGELYYCPFCDAFKVDDTCKSMDDIEHHEGCVYLLAKKMRTARLIDGEEFLQSKDIWNHPRVSDRNNAESYDVAELIDEYAKKMGGER